MKYVYSPRAASCLYFFNPASVLPPGSSQHEVSAAGWLAAHGGIWQCDSADCGRRGRAGTGMTLEGHCEKHLNSYTKKKERLLITGHFIWFNYSAIEHLIS